MALLERREDVAVVVVELDDGERLRCGAQDVADGHRAPADGDLLGVVLDPNVQIQESKVGSCDIRPGRRPHGEELLRLVAEYQSRAGTTVETGSEHADPVPAETARRRAATLATGDESGGD